MNNQSDLTELANHIEQYMRSKEAIGAPQKEPEFSQKIVSALDELIASWERNLQLSIRESYGQPLPMDTEMRHKDLRHKIQIARRLRVIFLSRARNAQQGLKSARSERN